MGPCDPSTCALIRSLSLPVQTRHKAPSGRRTANLRGDSLAVFTFCELLDHLPIESWDVVRLAAGDDAVINHNLLVDPVRAGVLQIGLQRWPGSDRPAAHGFSVDERPWSMANRGD